MAATSSPSTPHAPVAPAPLRTGFAIDVPGFETRRVNLTLRYVPDEHVVPYAALPAPARTQIRRYVERLATRSAYWARCLADVAI